MLDKNKQFQEFRRELEERGVGIRWAWQAKRDPTLKHPDVHFALFYGNGFQPKILTAIVIDYGERDGFALYIDYTGLSIKADADAIAGRSPVDKVQP